MIAILTLLVLLISHINRRIRWHSCLNLSIVPSELGVYYICTLIDVSFTSKPSMANKLVCINLNKYFKYSSILNIKLSAFNFNKLSNHMISAACDKQVRSFFGPVGNFYRYYSSNARALHFIKSYLPN